jgi:hypothetical protein
LFFAFICPSYNVILPDAGCLPAQYPNFWYINRRQFISLHYWYDTRHQPISQNLKPIIHPVYNMHIMWQWCIVLFLWHAIDYYIFPVFIYVVKIDRDELFELNINELKINAYNRPTSMHYSRDCSYYQLKHHTLSRRYVQYTLFSWLSVNPSFIMRSTNGSEYG